MTWLRERWHGLTHTHALMNKPEIGSLILCDRRVKSPGTNVMWLPADRADVDRRVKSPGTNVMWLPADRADVDGAWIQVESERAFNDLIAAEDLPAAYMAVRED